MAPLVKSRMTRLALEQTPEFRALSVKGQLWIQTYIQSLIDLGTADPILATQSAFQNEGENARTMSYGVPRQKKIQACLRVFFNFGKTARGIFLDDLQAEMDASAGVKRERLLALYGQMKFGAKPKKQKTKSKRRRS
jgi:hypothetical protein